MRYHIQILDSHEWHTVCHTPHVMNALRLLSVYNHEGAMSRAVQFNSDGKATSIVQTFSPTAN